MLLGSCKKPDNNLKQTTIAGVYTGLLHYHSTYANIDSLGNPFVEITDTSYTTTKEVLLLGTDSIMVDNYTMPKNDSNYYFVQIGSHAHNIYVFHENADSLYIYSWTYSGISGYQYSQIYDTFRAKK